MSTAIKHILETLIRGEDLGASDASDLMSAIMSGDLNEPQMAGILVALRAKGETVDEITGFVSAMRDKSIRVRPLSEGVVDTCGTGGDGAATFNISTATAFVSAGMGIPVAKHGNRAISSRCGSADVLDALDVSYALPPEALVTLVDDVGLGFLFAPSHHPAMKHVAGVRRGLGIRTVFNLLGPMLNPAQVKRQLIGVFDPALTETVAHVLAALGSEKVCVVHGSDGSDEITISGDTRVTTLADGTVATTTFAPEDVGIERQPTDAIRGGDSKENARHLLDVLEGKPGARRDAVLLNAAFVAVVADKAKDPQAGVEMAAQSIDSGSARNVLERLRERSQALAAQVNPGGA